MQGSSEEALLLAIDTRDELFQMFQEMFSSDNYHKVLMAYREGMTYSEISDVTGVSPGTISNAFDELEEHGLLTQGENGRQHTLPVLTHPMIQYYYWEEVVDDE